MEDKADISYSHTQKSYLAHTMTGISIVTLLILRPFLPAVEFLFVAGLGLFASLVTALLFGRLTVRDDGNRLVVRFGPLPLFGTRIPYADITAFTPDRSKFIDGWGIHYVPFRGTTYNVWGCDCVTFDLRGRIVRIGTDDPAGLTTFLESKIPGAAKKSPRA